MMFLHSKHSRRVLALLLATVLILPLFGNLGVAAEETPAVSVGDVFAADPAKWGTQNNNGWYYMYKDVSGNYHEMTWYDATAEVDWQKNSFASDPYTMYEMFYITQNTFFVGELGTKPTYAFKAPASGQIKLTLQTHSTSQIHMTVLKGTEELKDITFSTTGSLPGGMTENTVTVDVLKDEWLYLVCSSDDLNAQRQGWINEYSVEYLSLGEPVKAGDVFAPDMNNWGVQNNNGWYYLYKNTDGTYKEMTYFDGTAEIGWQQNAYSAPMAEVNEMFYINQSVFFVGENGRKPVYAFQAPAGGKVKLYVEIHGLDVTHLDVYKNAELAKTIDFVTTGTLEGGFTAHEIELEVKKGDWIYMEGYSTDHNAIRQGWVRNYKVTYLSTGSGVVAGDKLAPDMNAWGTQGSNGWYYMYQDVGGNYHEMPWWDATAEVPWQQNRYASDPYGMAEMFFITPEMFFVGELGSKPVYAFQAPASGSVELYFEYHGLDVISASIYKNSEKLQEVTFNTNGTLAGGHTGCTVAADVAKGDWMYIVCASSDQGVTREGWLRNNSVTYKTVDKEVAAGDTFVSDANAWGTQNNNGWYYMYKDTAGNYSEMPWWDDTASIDWQKNNFASDPYALAEMFYITQNTFFVGELGSKPVYAFKAPASGTVEVTVQTHSTSQIHMTFMNGTELVKVGDADSLTFVTTGTLPGGMTETTVTMNVTKGSMIYLECWSDDINTQRTGWINYYGVKYTEVTQNTQPEGPVEVPKVEESALEWNMKQDHYTQLMAKIADKSTPMTWLFVGDSITANDGDVSKGFRNYSEIFESYLVNQLGRTNDIVVNTAVSGWKAGNINYGRDIGAYNPDVVYVKVGTNDAFGSDAAAMNFKNTLKDLYGKIIEGGAIPVLGVANGFSSAWGNTQQTAEFAQRYPTVQRELAYEMNLLMVDYFTAYAEDQNRSDNNWFNPDTIHPNRQGFLALAQTFIGDLGLKQGELGIVTQNPDTVTGAELLPEAVLDATVFAYNDHIIDGTVMTLEQLKAQIAEGFVLMGGDNAVGKSASFITRRNIAQLLDNNNQKGRQVTFYGTAAELAVKLSTLPADKVILLMPEQGGAADLAAAIDEALAAGKKLAIITVPAASGDAAKAAKDALAAELKALAAEKGIPCIDVHGYFASISANAERINTQWYDENGVLNYAGAIEAATLIGNALGKDTVSFSSKRYEEDFSNDSWGQQGVNNWYYMSQDKATGAYSELPFISAADAAESWIADRFANPDPYQFLFVGKEVHHVSAAFNAVKAFEVDVNGRVSIKVGVKRHDTDVSEGGSKGSMYLTIYRNGEALQVGADATSVVVLAGGGAYQYYTLEADVKSGDMLYFVISADEACQGYMTQTVTYINAEAPVVDDEIPPTGDNARLGLWMGLMAVCAVCVGCAAIFGKKYFLG